MNIHVEFEIDQLNLGEVLTMTTELGEVFTEQIVIKEVVEAFRVKSDNGAIIITTPLPVTSNDDSISIGGA